MKKYYFVAKNAGWTNGSGWSYEETIESEWKEVPNAELLESDLEEWLQSFYSGWQDVDEERDVLTTWQYFTSEDTSGEPISEVSCWESKAKRDYDSGLFKKFFRHAK